MVCCVRPITFANLPSIDTDSRNDTMESTFKKGKKRLGFLPRPFEGGPETAQQEDEDDHTASNHTGSKIQLRHKPNRMSQSVILDSPY